MTDTLRTCRRCRRELPIERFYASGTGNGRRRTCIRCLREQDAQERRQRDAKVRHSRYNARGDVWCNRCQRYLPSDSFKRHPTRTHTYWSYCKPCTREIDRERYARKFSNLETALMEQGRHNHRRRIRLAAQRRERLRNVQEMIRLLRARGLTKSEICRLGGFTMQSLLRWEVAKVPSKRGISPNVEKRLGILVSAAIRVLPLPNETGILNYRRRLPHPDLPHLEAMCRDELARYPLRNSWINGKRDHERRRLV
jgi:hypothetical protein